ncbi:MAG: hypothetical protein MZV70_02410 [Desulfobacterales bacterium]|nr:hypothetical protein [Desulfobacterales bacterium]
MTRIGFSTVVKQAIFKNGLAPEAREVYRRARAVRIPQLNGQKMLVEYRFHPRTGKFATMFLVPEGPIFDRQAVSTVIDFYVPRARAPYDKLGNKNFILSLKGILFGNQSHRLSKQVREDFFNDDANFVLN